MPAGTVLWSDTGACPSGWAEYTTLRGRYAVGLPSGGTNAAQVGTALTNAENRVTGTHTHTSTTTVTLTDPQHAHNTITDPGHAHPGVATANGTQRRGRVSGVRRGPAAPGIWCRSGPVSSTEFTCRSLRTLNSRLYHVHFDIAAVLDVIDHDEVSVDLFAERDPAAAASIADYLTLWRGFLSGLRALASEAALFEDSFVGRAHLLADGRLGSHSTYGGAP